MELSKFQENIIDYIISGKVVDIISFGQQYFEFVDQNVTRERLSNDKTYANNLTGLSDGSLMEIKSSKIAFKQLQEYVALINLLEKANLILIEEKFDEFIHESDMFNKFPTILHFDFNKKVFYQPAEIHNLVWKYRTEYIITLPDLITFKKNGYKTNDELMVSNEARHRELELKLTKKLAYISIVFSLIMALINIISNSRDRNVYIEKMPQMDTVHVIVDDNK